ncbi:hypothetical protein BGX26_007761 [Mortierella sp. AD094]|nr:hypothetical protein BGX26_007761 [Mortierella sp. AD094]
MSDSDTATVTSVNIPSAHNAAATTTSSYPITTDPIKKLVWYRRLREIKGLLLFLISMAAMLDIINVASITIALPSILRDVGYDSNNLQCPSALALLTTTYPLGAERTFALSMFSGAAIIGQTVGVLLGGIFDATIGWQWIFYMTAILSAALSIAGFFIISDHEERASTVDSRIDYGGALCFTVGIVAIIYYLTESTAVGWASAKTLAPLFVGIAFLIGFVILESRIDYPIMPFHIWKSRRFLSSIIIIICLTATYNTMIFYSSLTFQNVLHYDSLITACCYIVHGVGLIIGLYTVTKLFILTRTKVIMFFGWCFVIGSSIVFAQIQPDSTYWHYAFPAFIINCMGLSPTWMCCQVNAVADAKDEDQGVVGAIFNVGVQLGAPIGLAIANIIAEAYTPDNLTDGATSVTDGDLMKGYSAAFYAYGVMGGIGLVMMLIFAANRDPAEFSEAAKAPAKVLEEVVDLERHELGGDKEEVLDESIEGKEEVGEEVGQKAELDSNSSAGSSTTSLDRTTIPAKKD